MSSVRVRFAPSPTGHLHIGGARTALFNWLFARSQGGTFVLRIEDTDRERSTDEYESSILEGMRWLGLDWDEGPFRQTERMDVYKERIAKLLAEGHAYYCYCTQEELEERRENAKSAGGDMRYDRRCRNLTEPVPGRTPSVRFKMPLEGNIAVTDLIKGNVYFDNNQIDDLIIARSDGTPTYNFVVVVDDVDMDITHVIRGDDHLNNTPKQLHIYRALGHALPTFAHLPMILGADKARLSKRHGATSVMAYRDAGFLPGALVNYLVRLGWSYGDQEVFSREELIKYFSFDNVGKSAAVFNPEKLLWLNAEYIKATPPEELARLVVPFLVEDGSIQEGAALDMPWLSRAVKTLIERVHDLRELAVSLRYYINEDVEFDENSTKKHLKEGALPCLQAAREDLSALDVLTEENVEAAFHAITERLEIKLGKLAQPVRVAMTGGAASPGIYELLSVIGRDKVLKRLDRAIGLIESGA